MTLCPPCRTSLTADRTYAQASSAIWLSDNLLITSRCGMLMASCAAHMYALSCIVFCVASLKKLPMRQTRFPFHARARFLIMHIANECLCDRLGLFLITQAHIKIRICSVLYCVCSCHAYGTHKYNKLYNAYNATT